MGMLARLGRDLSLSALSTSAGHVEPRIHPPAGENKGAVLMCLLDIEHCLSML